MITTIHQGTGHGIRRICAVLQVSRSSYYHAAKVTALQAEDVRIGDAIKRIFKKHKRRYGYRRIGSELSDEGIKCAPARVRRLMAERGLKAIQPKSYIPRTSDGRADKPSENLLLDQPLPEQPDCVWAGDITHIPTSKGWLYLAIVIDLCTRRIVGWALADHMRAELAVDALKQALGSRPNSSQCIFHSDRGSQYRSKGLSARTQSRSDATEHVGAGESIPQRLERISHRNTQKRDAARRTIHRPNRRTNRIVCIHRRLLQHHQKALCSELPLTTTI
jgi:putative transposase